MKHVALITGASRGIGLAFAELLARARYNLLLVARNEAQLVILQKRLRGNFDIQIETFSLDLSLADSGKKLIDFIQAKDIDIEVVVNNAGMGYCGEYACLAWEQEMQMMQLNIISLIFLTKYFVKEMLKKNSGSIINISSIAAFWPGPYMSSYYASKAYVLSFTESLAEEIKGSKVRLMALCPGPTRTDFYHQAGIRLSEKKLLQMPTAEQVASDGWRLLQKGKIVAVCGWRNKIFVGLIKILPRSIIRRFLAAYYIKVEKIESTQ